MDPSSLISAFGGVSWVIIAFIVALSIIVAVHEYGHYIVGRWCGIGADVFSLGFGPVLFSRVDKRGTRWQVAALPFGGYVKFAGDANAASAGAADDLPEMDDAARRRTMHGAPLWARSATVAAGPIFNFILSGLVFAVFYMMSGQVVEPLRISQMASFPTKYELQEGDQLVAINGVPASTMAELQLAEDAAPLEDNIAYTVLRDGDQITVTGPHPSPALATGVGLDSAAQDAGMRAGDVVTAIDGDPVIAFSQMVAKVQEAQGAPLNLDVWRDGETLQFVLQPRMTDERLPEGGFRTVSRIGLQGGTFFEPETRGLGPIAAVTQATAQVWLIIVASLDGLVNIVTGAISTCNLSGPIGIAETAGTMASLGPETFIRFIALLSTAVGLMNLFPIPILDGGHLVFHAYEAVTGKPPSDRALQVLIALGLALIGTLMVFAIGSDLFC